MSSECECWRCGETIEHEEDTGWVDKDGYVICQDWTGHDADGKYGPSHSPDRDECMEEDLKAEAVHQDGHPCRYCYEEQVKEELVKQLEDTLYLKLARILARANDSTVWYS